jgi:hypothetical protein
MRLFQRHERHHKSDPKCYQSVYPGMSMAGKPLQTVELRGFELLTSSMRTKRSTN